MEKLRGVRSARERTKRAFSTDRYIEALLVADTTLVDHFRHMNKSVTTYLLTIMNMVAEIYHHPSIGASFHISVVRMLIIDSNQVISTK